MITPEKLENYKTSLERDHRILKEKITHGHKHYMSDIEIEQLKKEKLLLKDKIENIKTQLRENSDNI